MGAFKTNAGKSQSNVMTPGRETYRSRRYCEGGLNSGMGELKGVSRRVVPAPLSSRFGGEGSLSEEMKMKETQFCSWSVCISQHQTCKGFNKKRELGRAQQSSKSSGGEAP